MQIKNGCLMIFLLSFGVGVIYAQKIMTFPQALEAAYKNNPDLQAQIQKANEVKGMFIQSKQFWNPSLMLEGENIGGSGAYKGLESAETTLSIMQPIPLGDKLHYKQKAADAEYRAMLASIKTKLSKLYISVGKAYLDALYAEKWHQVAKKLTNLNKGIVSDIKKRKISGASADLDLKLSQIALGEAEIEQSKARRQIKKAYAFLSRLLGTEILDSTNLSDNGLPHQKILWSVIKKRIDDSPILAEKQLQLKASRAAIIATKKDVWPTLALQVGARHFSDDNKNALVVSVSAPLPVFDKNQGKIYSANANHTRIMKNLLSKKLELEQQLFSDFLDVEQYSEELHKIKNVLLPTAKKAVEIATSGYNKGLYSYVELSTSMHRLFEEERHYQDSHAKLDQAQIKILGLLLNKD